MRRGSGDHLTSSERARQNLFFKIQPVNLILPARVKHATARGPTTCKFAERRNDLLMISINANSRLRLTIGMAELSMETIATRRHPAMTMSRVYAALIASAVAAIAVPTAASAGCYNCYAPPQPCATCYQQQFVPPQYRTVQETVMVSPGSVIAHRTPAQYRTVMVPQTVMVAPEGVAVRADRAAVWGSRARRDGRTARSLLRGRRRRAATPAVTELRKPTRLRVLRPSPSNCDG